MEPTIHAVSSKLILIAESSRGYKKQLRDTLDIVLQKDESSRWAWQKFESLDEPGRPKRVYEYATFEQYLIKWSRFTFKELCSLFDRDPKDAVIFDKLTAAGQVGKPKNGQHGNGRPKPQKVAPDNISSYTDGYGTAKSYTLRRLAEHHPELHTRVLTGELSTNAAAIAAGIRKRPTPLDSVMKVWRGASPEDRRRIAAFVAGAMNLEGAE